jgi:cytochrome c biogenesis protein
LLAAAGVVGTVMRQLPAFALHDPTAYSEQMALIHQAYDSTTFLGLSIGPAMVDIFEKLGFFRVFSAPWFVLLLTVLTVSITICTLDRTPRLWRSVRHVNPVQPPAFYQLGLAERAHYAAVEPAAVDDLAQILREKRYKLRVHDIAGVRHVYGDRNQYFKLATLFTHLGLILFLAGGAITVAAGFETVIFLGEGQTAPVQAVGTADNLLVKNIHFEAPTRPDGSFEDFRTDLAVYQNGQLLARKTIHVNDPLEAGGFVFHQNTFGPAENLVINDPTGKLVWDGPVILAGELAGRPQGFLTVPGSKLGLLLVLDRTSDGIPLLAITGLGATDDPDQANVLFLRGFGVGATSDPAATAGYTISWQSAGAFTGMVIKRDPGQGVIWLAFLSLFSGLVLTFYFPRRRVWARLDENRLSLALAGDRYVNTEREFVELLETLSTRLGRRPERRLGT